jgi:L-aminopeptidase/D-esterase-like protein
MAGPNAVYPDAALGRAAVRAANRHAVPLGPHGAGRAARVGKGPDWSMGEPCGQGAAFAQAGETKVLVVTVVNAIGAIVDRQGRVVRGHRRPNGERARIEDLMGLASTAPDAPVNTTLTAVVTNQRVGGRDLTQLARQVHAAMARAIQPFHTANDGDTLFAVSTYDVTNEALPTLNLGVLASELVWDAVLASF